MEHLLNFHRFAGFKYVLIKCFGESEPKGCVNLFWEEINRIGRLLILLFYGGSQPQAQQLTD